jgi:hypothetical protein
MDKALTRQCGFSYACSPDIESLVIDFIDPVRIRGITEFLLGLNLNC